MNDLGARCFRVRVQGLGKNLVRTERPRYKSVCCAMQEVGVVLEQSGLAPARLV